MNNTVIINRHINVFIIEYAKNIDNPSRIVKNNQVLKKLTPQHKRAIALLISGKNQRSVAALLQVREETVSRWMHEPIFRKALSEAHNTIFKEVQEKYQLASRLALEALIYAVQQREVTLSRKNGHSARVEKTGECPNDKKSTSAIYSRAKSRSSSDRKQLR